MAEDFLWGAATSSHQVEGDNRHNDWWAWEQQGNIEGNVSSGKAVDHWNRYVEDIRLASEMGLNAYRFSVEWSRLEPEEGKWDKSALDWYAALVGECEKRGLMPMLTLHHFTTPQWLAARGGFLSDDSVGRFAGYVRKVISAVGPRIPLWCTLNEPNVLVLGQYLGRFMPPAEYKPENCAVANRNLLLAHVRAYDLIRAQAAPRLGPWKDRKPQVGLAINLVDFRPLRAAHVVERTMAAFVRHYYNGCWPDAVTGRRQHFGVPGLIPAPKQVWEARKRRTADFIGINYYTKIYVCWGPQKEEAHFVKSRLFPIGIAFSKKSDRVSDLGWPLHPEGLGRMIRFLSRYKLPLYITENGIADASDALRSEYLKTHLEVLADAKAKGADVRGYFHWSLMDNFEWIKGFTPRFGLLEVDYGDFSRRMRPSAERLSRMLHALHGAPPTPEAVRQAFLSDSPSQR